MAGPMFDIEMEPNSVFGKEHLFVSLQNRNKTGTKLERSESCWQIAGFIPARSPLFNACQAPFC
jgi:hypothetical protein